ncbi:MAG TPA: hypothetical protein V6C78_03750 [Crinalium sp.]
MNTATERPVNINLYQQWQLQPGDRVVGYPVTSSLGDISVAVHGDRVYAPFNGSVRPSGRQDNCVFFVSTEVPAYLFRLCGLKQPRLGATRQGEAIARADTLVFATLRKQPSGNWAMVEPSVDILERLLTD